MTNLEIAVECGAEEFFIVDHDRLIEFGEAALAAYTERIQTSAYAEGRKDQAETSACKWWIDEFSGAYETSCGHCFEFFDGRPRDNDFKHCPYCGGVLKEIKG